MELKEKEIKILMIDRCTRSEAISLLKRGSTVYEDLEENFNLYMEEWDFAPNSEEYRDFKRMIETGCPIEDWGVVEMENKRYYIEYCL